MNLDPSPAFNRDLRRIRDRHLQRRIARKIQELEASDSISEVVGVRPMTGWERHYRIRIGNYRMGLAVDGNVVTLLRFLHRRDIYRYFP